MDDPSRIVLDLGWLLVIRFEKFDRSGAAPWGEVMDPRRYSVTLWPGTSRRRSLFRGSLYRPAQW